MSGRQLAERIVAKKPGIKVLFLSGYAADAAVRRGIVVSGVAFLQKPFTLNALVCKARNALDRAVGLHPISEARAIA